MKIREATNADSAAVKELVFTVLKAYGLRPDPVSTDRDLSDIEKHYAQNRGCFCVLEWGEKILGCYGLFHVDQETCELRKMYLDPTCRGKGYGKMLLEDALQAASRLGYRIVSLETASVLKEAIALYRKYGFEPYDANHLSPRCDQAYRKTIN